MPSGSYLTVHSYTNKHYKRGGTYLNIHLYPLRVDAYHTTGLCGNYNLDPSDDGPAAGNQYCTANCEKYRQGRLLLLTIGNELFRVYISHIWYRRHVITLINQSIYRKINEGKITPIIALNCNALSNVIPTTRGDIGNVNNIVLGWVCLLYTSPSPRD